MYIKYRYRNLPGEKMPLIKNMDAIRKPKNVRCQTRMENVNFVFNIRVRKIFFFCAGKRLLTIRPHACFPHYKRTSRTEKKRKSDKKACIIKILNQGEEKVKILIVNKEHFRM